MKFLKWQDASPEQKNEHILNVYGNGQGWTKDTPQWNGYYFAIPILPRGVTWANGPVPQLVSVNDELVLMVGKDFEYKQSDFTDWLGPIPEPEPPTKGE